MNRSEGLVQRRNVTQVNTNSASDEWGGWGSDNEEKGKSEEAHSKETRLTLMEEVLLLGLKDREVCMLNIWFICQAISVAYKCLQYCQRQ